MSDAPVCPACGADGEPTAGNVQPGVRCTDRRCRVVLFKPEGSDE